MILIDINEQILIETEKFMTFLFLSGDVIQSNITINMNYNKYHSTKVQRMIPQVPTYPVCIFYLS